MSAGELHSAAVDKDGDCYTWGDGFCGQLGHKGYKGPSMAPKLVELGGLEDEVVVSVSCGGRHTLFVTEDGEVWSCGLGHFGALGRSHTPFEYDADAAFMNLGDEGVAGVDEAEDPRPANAEPPADGDALQAEIRANLDFINNITLEDSSNQTFPMLIDSLQSVKIVAASAGHRHS